MLAVRDEMIDRQEEKERRNSYTAGRRGEAIAPRKTHSHVMGVYLVQGLPRVSIVAHLEISEI